MNNERPPKRDRSNTPCHHAALSAIPVFHTNEKWIICKSFGRLIVNVQPFETFRIVQPIRNRDDAVQRCCRKVV
jgi:hypothetical protein